MLWPRTDRSADHARIMGAVIATVRDWQVAEDALQDACERALTAWTQDGVPANADGWLVTTARRRGIDLLGRASGRESTLQRYGTAVDRGWLDSELEREIGDDRLRLVLTCAHPALSLASRAALTLRTVLGWPPADIARSFLTTEAAIHKRLVRARAKIAHDIPYRLPSQQDLPDRIDGVLAVVYLLFTTGYADVGRADLMGEALRSGGLSESCWTCRLRAVRGIGSARVHARPAVATVRTLRQRRGGSARPTGPVVVGP